MPTDPSDHPPKNIGISFIRYRGNQGSPKSIKSLCQTHPPNFPSEHNITPNPTDRAFYPLPTDIKNHVGNAKRALDLSKLDQENLRLKIEAWKELPESCHYFRPYISEQSDKQSPQMPSTKSEHTPGICTGANGSDDTDWVLQGASTEFSQPLLWVHQNEWQKELLGKCHYTH